MKPYLPIARLSTAVCTLVLLASCGGSGGSSNSGSGSGGTTSNAISGFDVSANFIKGPVSGGFCELFRVDSNGSRSGSLGASGASVEGLALFSDPIEYSGTLLIQCSGGTYQDEATGFTLNAPETRAVASLNSDSEFVVTPFTEMAFQLAEAQGDLGSSLTGYNHLIAGIFGIDGDITRVLPTAAIGDIEEGTEADHYLLALLLLSRLNADSPSSVREIVTGLVDDLADDGIDSDNATVISAALETLASDASGNEFLVELYSALETAIISHLDDSLADEETSCGDGETDCSENDEPVDEVDQSAPIGYSIFGLTNPINLANQSEVRFSVDDAEVGASYVYELYSSADGQNVVLQGSGTVSASAFNVTGLDLSQAGDGVIELRFFLTDEANNQGQTLTVTSNKNSDPVGNVAISGIVTFDRVGRNSINGALDYNDISAEPARGVTVEAVNSSGTELASTATDSNGQYHLEVTEHTYVRIRARAEMISNDVASWNLSVKDNTNNDALYALQGDLFSSGGEDNVRSLNAGSGWTGAAYTNTRSAAPFAILDTVYKVMDKFLAVHPDINFPKLDIFWSRNNNSASSNINQGDIGTSYYSSGSFYILGDEDGDTDEYDEHIIAHEWGHYFEDRMSRSDSIGGSHSLNDRLDMRVAFGEGWGNAISAIALDDPVYTDSSGPGQAFGFTFDIEENDHSTKGWYSVASAQSILYDIYDNQSDDADTLSLGLSPIYNIFITPDYINTDYLTSIFVFLDKLGEVIPGSAAGIGALALEQDINGTGPDGSGETNNGGIAETLPLYKNVSVDGASVELCSNEQYGAGKDNHNILGGRDFAFLEIAFTQSVEIVINKVSGEGARDPDMTIWKQGQTIEDWISESPDEDHETWNGQLSSGNYVLEVYDYNITNEKAVPGTLEPACFELTVSTG